MPRWLARRRPVTSAPATRRAFPERAANRKQTPAACRSSRAPSSSRVRPGSRALPVERVPFDFLVQVRAWHLERSRGLAHVPVVLAQLGEQKRALRGLLELLEGLAVEQRADPRLIRVAPT